MSLIYGGIYNLFFRVTNTLTNTSTVHFILGLQMQIMLEDIRLINENQCLEVNYTCNN